MHQSSNQIFYYCHYCDRNFKQKSTFESNYRLHSKKGLFECDTCQRKYTRKSVLLVHMKSHLYPETHMCTICQKVLKNETAYRAHMKTHTKLAHRRNSALQCLKEANLTDSKDFICDLCGQGYLRLNSLKKHISAHYGKKYKCQECGRKFSQKYQVLAHMVVHSGEKNFLCDSCGHASKRKDTLEAHMKTHKKAVLCERVTTNLTHKLQRKLLPFTESNHSQVVDTYLKRNLVFHDSNQNHYNNDGENGILSNNGSFYKSNVPDFNLEKVDKLVCANHKEEYNRNDFKTDHDKIYDRDNLHESRHVLSKCMNQHNKHERRCNNIFENSRKPKKKKLYKYDEIVKGLTVENNTLIVQISASAKSRGTKIKSMNTKSKHVPAIFRKNMNIPMSETLKINLNTNAVLETTTEKEQSKNNSDLTGKYLNPVGSSINNVQYKPIMDNEMINLIQDIEQPNSRYQCVYCPNMYTSKSALTAHLKLHTLKGVFKCEKCSKMFTAFSKYRRHVDSHFGVKNFCCDICGMKFTAKQTLTDHTRLHRSEKNYKCVECFKRFSKKDTLARHMVTHSGLKPHQCHKCSKTFTQRARLAAHLRTHTGLRPYLCSNCGKSFTRKDVLNVHLRTHYHVNSAEMKVNK